VQLSQSQDRVADLEVKTTEQEHRISSLALEHQFVKEQVTKLESDIAKKSSELSGANALLSAKEDELERLRDELSNLSREHSRLVASQSRDLAEQTDRAGTSKKQLEELIRSQARAEAENNSLNDRVRSLSGELDRMRKLVHNLQHESADKDLKLAQAKKQQDKDAEELRNFNIALDSKQQELELVCAALLCEI
jgi:chromosome segregation ATPase